MGNKRDTGKRKTGICNEYVMMQKLCIHGEGIGRIEGFTMFVEGALPGEKVRIRSVKIRKDHGYGRQWIY